MEPHINALSIEGFRTFRSLNVKGLGQVSLITGCNNTGKSSALDALRLLASDGSLSVIASILHSREEDADEGEESARWTEEEGAFPLSSLFHGFPEFSGDLKPISLSSNGGRRPMELTLTAGWYSEERGDNGSRRLVLQQLLDFGEGDALPALILKGPGGERLLPLPILRRNFPYPHRLRMDAAEEMRLPCQYVSPYGGEQTARLGALWDKIALSDQEEDVVEALRIIDSAIVAISMVGGERPRQHRTAIVRSKTLPRPVPLRSFGDGMNRLFGIILSLVNAKGGLLLIDEFENGMHHTVQTDVWKALFRLAERLDTQVVATSHSWDAIEAFQKAAAEHPSEGVLVRLSRKGEDVIPSVFREDELAVAAREGIEVR
ncbi:MAG TPA: ATP-binding protein [Candidatus Hydrogenedentes bacterium]|nr:ATP-binding protein [Candidatus Hydrogenedentota bacterium]